MSVSETKLIESSWESKGDECYPAWKLQRNFLDINDLLKDMEEIVQEAGLGSIGYRSQESEINEISQDMLHLNAYIRSAIPELEDRLDKPLCKHFNQNATESISRISLDEYTTENKLGMKRWELRTGPGGLPVKRLMDAPTLTMEDFMGLTTLEEQADRSLVGMPKAFSNFTEMFAVDYNLLKERLSKENGKEVTLEEYLLSIRDAGKFDHKMSKPVQEFLSVVLDATIVKPLIESVTGEDLITGEDLSDFEREMKIVSGVVSLFTLGQGGVVISSGRVVMQSTLVTMGKMVAIDMVTTGVTYGTSELCQKMGLPGSVTMLLSMLAGGKAGSVLNNKWLANVSAEDAARYNAYWSNVASGRNTGKEILNESVDPDVVFKEYMEVVEHLDVTTKPNTATFYSGKGNRELAEEFARTNGKTTLEMTKGGQYLDAENLFASDSPLSKEQARDVWARLSQRYAEGTSGNTYGFVQGARPESIFNTVEYPALQANPNVTNVFTELMQ